MYARVVNGYDGFDRAIRRRDGPSPDLANRPGGGLERTVFGLACVRGGLRRGAPSDDLVNRPGGAVRGTRVFGRL